MTYVWIVRALTAAVHLQEGFVEKSTFFKVAQASVAEAANKTDRREQSEDGPDEEGDPESRVTSLAFDRAGSQLTAVVGKYALHMWSMVPER